MYNKGYISYYFGRLNIISLISKEDKPGYIYNSLISGVKIRKYGNAWGFFNVEKINYDNNYYFFGILVKYKEDFETETANEQSNMLETTMIPAKTIDKYEFVLHSRTGLIAYHSRGNRDRKTFRNYFCELIQEANNNMFINVEIQTIHDEIKIKEALREFDKINKVDIILHPSNPTNRERWKKTDDRLQQMKVERFKETYYGKNIIIDDESEVFGDILMAGDGYGVATIEGEKDSEPKIVSTDKLPIKDYADKENSLLIIKKLSKTFHKILERFDKNES